MYYKLKINNMETKETAHYTEIQETRVSRVSWAAVFGGSTASPGYWYRRVNLVGY